MTSADERTRLREIAAAATPGEWKHEADGNYVAAADGQMNLCDIRGWGYLTGQGGLALSDEAANAIQDANGNHIAAFNPATALRLLDTIERQERALEVARDALTELQLGHEHNTNEGDHYRPLGDTYGWCHICSTKVGLNEDVVREALARIKEILG